MKLSKAIQQGAVLRDQAYGSLYQTAERPVAVLGILGLTVVEKRSCAMGAALEVAGFISYEETVTDETAYLRRDGVVAGQKIRTVNCPAEWRDVIYAQENCPQCEVGDIVVKLIAHLNDDHRWKREEIARWVARVESSLEWLSEAKEMELPCEIG